MKIYSVVAKNCDQLGHVPCLAPGGFNLRSSAGDVVQWPEQPSCSSYPLQWSAEEWPGGEGKCGVWHAGREVQGDKGEQQ